MTQQVEQIIEAAAQRCGGAEVYEERGETRSVSFENNRLKRITARQFRGVGLRVLVDGRIGFASTTDLRDPARLVEMAVESAQFGEKARFELPASPAEPTEVETEDPAVGDVTLEQMVAMGREGLEMSSAASDEYLFSASISTKTGAQRVLNTAGLDFEYTGTDMAGTAELEEVTDGGLLTVYEFKSWGRPFDSIADVTEEALRKMEQGRRVVPAGSDRMPVIFTPKAGGNLFSPIMLALSGKQVQKGSSVLAGKIGEKVLDERITIVDDPSVAFAPGSSPMDDEGMPTRVLPLVENGVVRNYLLDLQTAGLLGMEPTANGYRSYASRPSPSSANTMVAAGDTPWEEMLGGTERALIVDQTLGSGQSNVLAGEFSVNVSLGLLVEGGEIRGRVKDCMVAGNVYELLSDVEAIGSERQWLGANCGPPICVGGIRLAAQG